jgi:hypothetical protein
MGEIIRSAYKDLVGKLERNRSLWRLGLSGNVILMWMLRKKWLEVRMDESSSG